MSAEENRALVLGYVEQVFNAGRLDTFNNWVAPDYRRYLSPAAEPLTVEMQIQRLAGLRAAFPNIHLTVEDLIAEGDRVVFRVTLTGTHQGTFQGIPATNRDVMVAALDIVRIENGKICEHWGGPDTFAILQQLGAVISAGPRKP